MVVDKDRIPDNKVKVQIKGQNVLRDTNWPVNLYMFKYVEILTGVVLFGRIELIVLDLVHYMSNLIL